MTYGTDGFGDSFEPEGFEFEGFEGEGFGDPFEPEGFDDREAGGGALARIDSETAAMLMDMYAGLAAEAESEEEADAFLPLIAGLAPMAFKALAPIGKKLFAKAAPKMSRGVLSAGRKMLSRFGRKGVEALPDIARGVARDSLQKVADGQDLTGEMVMRSAAQHTLPFLQDPQQAQQAAHHRRQRARRWRSPYPPQQQQGYPPEMQGYPPEMQGYPPAMQGYPPAMQGYPPAMQGYPPAMQGYPPQQQQGYPPEMQGYPSEMQGYPPEMQQGYGPPPQWWS
jgi:hypothetical protein